MSDGPPPIASFEALGVHFWHLQQQLSAQSEQITRFQTSMATHADMKAMRDDVKAMGDVIATLVTRTALDADLNEIREEIKSSRPSTIIGDLARLCAGLAVIGAFVAGVVALIGPFLKVAGT